VRADFSVTLSNPQCFETRHLSCAGSIFDTNGKMVKTTSRRGGAEAVLDR